MLWTLSRVSELKNKRVFFYYPMVFLKSRSECNSPNKNRRLHLETNEVTTNFGNLQQSVTSNLEYSDVGQRQVVPDRDYTEKS